MIGGGGGEGEGEGEGGGHQEGVGSGRRIIMPGAWLDGSAGQVYTLEPLPGHCR